MPQGRPRIGTSGWSYAHWSRGRFYPPGLPSGDWLRHYARHFPTVEINLSFYRIPTPAMVDRWRKTAPPGFVFAHKLWRGITHLKRLADTQPAQRSFLEVVDGLGDRRGPLLVQLPPSMKRDLPRLEGFLDELHEAQGSRPGRVAVEFRNPGWIVPEVYAALDRRNVALCLADMAKCPIVEPNEADFVYIRRHGSGRQYEGRYGEAEIEADADRIRGWLDRGRDVYVYYNNDIGGHAVDNAQYLQQCLGA